MMTDALVAKKYLAPSLPTFWRWEHDGSAVTLPTGELLAFRPELADALGAFDAGGLPPIGAVLLVLDAMKRGWKNRAALDRLQSTCVSIYENAGRYLPAELQERVAGRLATFHEVISAVDDPAQRIAALQLVFDGCVTEVPADQAGAVVETLRAGPAKGMLAGSASRDGFDRLLLDLRTLDAGLSRVTKDALGRYTNTGLEADIQPIEELEELPPACDAARSMIEHLCADEQHAALGKVTRDLLAALRLPRGLGQPRDLPLGGLSDITNRGQLDRLLLSELAQDDLTLAVRVANNEALYLRREEGKTRPPISRELIIDVGLRQWGVPRLIAVAAALALCAGGDAGVELACHHTTHAGLAPTDPLTPEGLETLLGKLELNLTPAAAIEQASERFGPQDDGELVVITHAQSLKHPSVARALSDQRAAALYIVTIDGTGRVELLARTDVGMRRLAHTVINPDDLLNKSQKTLPLLDPAKDASFPAAIRQRLLPLCVPHQFDMKSAWFSPTKGHRAYVLTSDHRLTMWQKRSMGPIQLSDTLPSNKLLWCAATSQPAPIDAIIGRLGKNAQLHTLSIDLANNSVDVRPIELPGESTVIGVTCQRGVVLVVTRTYTCAIDPLTGQVLAQVDFPRGSMRGIRMDGRYLYGTNHTWYQLQYDANQIQIDPFYPKLKPYRILKIVEHEGIDSPTLVSRDAAIYRDFDPPREALNCLLEPLGYNARVNLSRDNKRIQLYTVVKKKMLDSRHVVIGGQDIEVTNVTPGTLNETWLEPDVARLCVRRSPRVKFIGAQFMKLNNGQPALELVSRKDISRLVIRGDDLYLSTQRGRDTYFGYQSFRTITPPAGSRYKLSAINYNGAADAPGLDPQGTLHLPNTNAPAVRKGRIVLDSRGMLHLQPDDDALGEVTLVLDQDRVSGWFTDGRVFGDRYYFPNPDAIQLTGADAYRELILPILKRMM